MHEYTKCYEHCPTQLQHNSTIQFLLCMNHLKRNGWHGSGFNDMYRLVSMHTHVLPEVQISITADLTRQYRWPTNLHKCSTGNPLYIPIDEIKIKHGGEAIWIIITMEHSPKKLTVPQLVNTFHILWKMKVHYLVHNSLSLVPILSQKNSVHALPSYFFKICFNIIPPLHPGPPNTSLQAFPQKPCRHLFSAECTMCPHHLILDLITQIVYGGE
jgi:hypothetical protein